MLQAYERVRRQTLALTATLTEEDHLLQSMPDASPVKWHLAHTSWFFERFVLAQRPGFEPFWEDGDFLFNSYYEGVGARHPRPQRGLLSRPALKEVLAYRKSVDERMGSLLLGSLPPELSHQTELGLHHEQQHQELILTDIKHAFAAQPRAPAWASTTPAARAGETLPIRWHEHGGGVQEMGHAGSGFGFDNERPKHRVFVERFVLANRLVTSGEYLEFMRDGGYQRPDLWLSDGWLAAQQQGWRAPLYWQDVEGQLTCMGPQGRRPVDVLEPVCHVSFYEADAYARWASARLPTEAEWESVARREPVAGNLLESGAFHPRRASGDAMTQLFGDTWEWTGSAYLAYPGFVPESGLASEYNGKFMCNQMVLKGGSCATPSSHIRASYRNFFPPGARWQFSGIRLARSA